MTSPSRPPLLRRGFSLVELLVVIAVIAVLVGLVALAAGTMRGAAVAARETALARQLMGGYLAYATDHRGMLMPGYHSGPPALEAKDAQGNPLSGQSAARYPWRLAPYLDYQVEALVQDPVLREELRHAPLQFEYFVSLYPSLGLNSIFLGGDNGSGYAPYNAPYLKRLSQARRPADLIVFGSARVDGNAAMFKPGAPPIVEGHFRIVPPAIDNPPWAERWSPQLEAKQWGYVSMRLNKNREAAFGFLDGHTELLDDGEVKDMRRWADAADSPDWTLP